MNIYLKELLSELNITQKKFAEVLEIKQNTLSNYILGKNNLPIELMIKINTLFKINLHWLITGRGEVFENTSQIMNTTTNDDILKVAYFPTIQASAGFGSFNTSEKQEYINIDKKIIKDKIIHNPVVINSTGNSMQPTIRDNDLLIVDYSSVEVIEDSAIYIVRINDSLLVKSIRPTIDGIELISFNKEYTPQSIPKLALEDGRAEILGKVILNISSI